MMILLTLRKERSSVEHDERKKRTGKKSCRALAFFACIPFKVKLIIAVVLIAALAAGSFAIGMSRSGEISSNMTRLRLEDLGEFATQAGYFTTVQTISDSVKWFGKTVPFTTSKYIFSYNGVVKAGLDFSKVSIDVNTLTSTITVSAPAVEILSTEVDEDSLVIYDESRNIFTPLTLDDVKLSRTAMIDEIKTQAVNNNLLENARANAEVWIRLFLQTAYDPNEYAVEFKWQKESAR